MAKGGICHKQDVETHKIFFQNLTWRQPVFRAWDPKATNLALLGIHLQSGDNMTSECVAVYSLEASCAHMLMMIVASFEFMSCAEWHELPGQWVALTRKPDTSQRHAKPEMLLDRAQVGYQACKALRRITFAGSDYASGCKTLRQAALLRSD